MRNLKIDIRALTTLAEMAAVEDLQRTLSGDDLSIYHRHQLIAMVRNGAVLLGAYDGERLVGYVFGYMGTEAQDSSRPAMANLKLASQRMAVLPEYRDQGIGYELKLAQRQYAIKQGIRLITWTFDPLQSRNAHLNIRKLGAIVRDYWRDYYGTSPSPHVTLGSSDRAIVEWWVTHNRVEQRIHGKRIGLSVEQYTNANATILNPTRLGANGLPQPDGAVVRSAGMVALIEIPSDYNAIVQRDPDLAWAWRLHSRDLLEQALASGYTVTDFVHGNFEGRERSFYALTYSDAPPTGFSNN
jgi:predicted GNAT superfamily acetyltransferase